MTTNATTNRTTAKGGAMSYYPTTAYRSLRSVPRFSSTGVKQRLGARATDVLRRPGSSLMTNLEAMQVALDQWNDAVRGRRAF